MGMFTFKIVKIEESGSIGRQLKASITANGVTTEFGFEGNTTKHHILLKDADIESKALVVPVSIQVSEIDKKYPDGPFPGAGKYSVDPSKGDKQDFTTPLPVPITEMGAKGKNKGKKAMLNFYFEANITCRGGKNNRTTSDEGIDFIKSFEKVTYTKYLDQAGNPTIGAGHKIQLPKEQYLMEATLDDVQVNALLAKDLAVAESSINTRVQVCLTQNQFNALISFAFNVGTGQKGFSGSTLLKKINASAPETEIRAEFSKWNKVNGKPSSGLTKRRKAEADLYFAP